MGAFRAIPRRAPYEVHSHFLWTDLRKRSRIATAHGPQAPTARQPIYAGFPSSICGVCVQPDRGFYPSMLQINGLFRTPETPHDAAQRMSALHRRKRGQQISKSRVKHSYIEARVVLQWVDAARGSVNDANLCFEISSRCVIARCAKDGTNVLTKAVQEERGALVNTRAKKRNFFFERLERKLLQTFNRRQQQGKQLGAWWFRMELQTPKWQDRLAALSVRGVPHSKQFTASYTYLRSFFRRHDFKFVRAGNLRKSDMADVLISIQHWCIGLRDLVLVSPEGHYCDPAFGRFPPHCRFDMDQVLCQFAFDGERRTWASHMEHKKKHVEIKMMNGE